MIARAAVEHPLASVAVAAIVALAIAARILRFEIRAQRRARRRGGFLIGRDQ